MEKITRKAALIVHNDEREIFSVEEDGRILLHGKEIGNDEELAGTIIDVSNPKLDFISDQWNSQIDAMIAEIDNQRDYSTGDPYEIGIAQGLLVAKQILLTYKR